VWYERSVARGREVRRPHRHRGLTHGGDEAGCLRYERSATHELCEPPVRGTTDLGQPCEDAGTDLVASVGLGTAEEPLDAGEAPVEIVHHEVLYDDAAVLRELADRGLGDAPSLGGVVPRGRDLARWRPRWLRTSTKVGRS
jgi:hypothetical protein